MSKQTPQLIVALDAATLEEAQKLVDTLSPAVDIFKVGSQLFTACGPRAVEMLRDRKKQVFLDLKYHDIPNTVANAVTAAVNLPNIVMYTLHINGGAEMLKMAVEAGSQEAEKMGVKPPFSLGITVLTSTAKQDNIHRLTLERARLALECGLDGVVASGQETALLRRELGKEFVIVTPGIRPQAYRPKAYGPKGAGGDDQKRITTPAEAVRAGSNFLVVGRPIVQAADPLKAAEEINAEIRSEIDKK